MRALHARGPLIQYWVEGRWDGFRLSAAGMTEGVGGGAGDGLAKEGHHSLDPSTRRSG